MCGILAALGCADASACKRARVIELSHRLWHRGPDCSGIFQHGNSFLAHERLAIIDTTAGPQPVFNESKTIAVVANGEIYNHEELRGKVSKPQKFHTHNDSEVIAHLYEDVGEDVVSLLDGMFSFVLLDTRDNSYIAARDPIGITPLYMGRGADGSVWFASEMKALNDDCETFEVFPPGHIYSSKTGTLRRWYNARWTSDLETKFVPSTPYDPLALRAAFEKSVVKRLMTDVPFGVLLSGGLDSSLVAAVASRHLAETKAGHEWGTQLHTFCVGLKGSPDLKAAREVANSLGTLHEEFHFTIQEGLDAIREVIYHIETYDVTTIRASTPMLLLSRNIKNQKIKDRVVKMVLSGEGSDEIFGGYLYFHKAPSKAELHFETVRKLQALHMFDCLRANKSTMAVALEARVPFLDKDFLDLAMSIDPAEKMIRPREGRIEKYILRKAFDDEERPFLPRHILYRQKEQFSDGVGYGWIDGLKDYAASQVTDEMMANAVEKYPHNTPSSKEAYFYRQIFEEHFPQKCALETVPGGPSVACSTATAFEWSKAWANNADPSGRAVHGVHKDGLPGDSVAGDAHSRLQAKKDGGILRNTAVATARA